MRFLYNSLFTIGFVLSAPYYFFRIWGSRHWRAGFSQRFGFYDSELKQAFGARPNIWLHAVSVGEVGGCVGLIRVLEARLPECRFVVSTTTSTGMGELRRKLPARIQKIYNPVDFWWGVRQAMQAVKPRAMILVEAEIWPNFLWQALDRNVPLFLVYTRFSDRSLRGYRRFSRLFRPLFSRFAGVGCQDAEDAVRLASLGFPPSVVHAVGNLKFDTAKPEERPNLDAAGLLRLIGIAPGALLPVAGSTHEGEEIILAEMAGRLRQRFSDLFLVLVPWHFERSKEIGAELEKRKVKFILRSEITVNTRLALGQVDCLLVNSTGELKAFYRKASLVFIGKSLTAEGGQNPIEPAALGKPLIFGPNMQNFPFVAPALLKNQGAIQVQTPAELEATCGELLQDAARRNELGHRALRVVQAGLEATQRTADFIAAHPALREISCQVDAASIKTNTHEYTAV